MSKRYKDPNVAKVMAMAEENQILEKPWINSRGDSMILRAIPPMLIQMATESISLPVVPTYTIELEGGGTETHMHDEESIEQSGPEEKKKWEDYKKELVISNTKATEVLLNVILLEGVVLTFADPARLEKRLTMMGVKLPEDPDEKEFMLKKAYAISSGNDAGMIMNTVMELTGIKREDIDNLKNSFPGDVESKP